MKKRTYGNNLPFAITCPKCRHTFVTRGQHVCRWHCSYCDPKRAHMQMPFAPNKPQIDLLETYRNGGVYKDEDGYRIGLTPHQMAAAKRLMAATAYYLAKKKRVA
jgi:hypothetical protein